MAVSTSEFNLEWDDYQEESAVWKQEWDNTKKRRDSKERKSSREGEVERERELVVAEEILDWDHLCSWGTLSIILS